MALLRCVLFPGQFSSEFAVVVKVASGREFSLFSNHDDVVFQEPPTNHQSVEGWIRVDIVEIENERCLVRLPQTTLENGQFVTVLKSQLREKPAVETRMRSA